LFVSSAQRIGLGRKGVFEVDLEGEEVLGVGLERVGVFEVDLEREEVFEAVLKSVYLLVARRL
jgi:hypothetical protein